MLDMNCQGKCAPIIYMHRRLINIQYGFLHGPSDQR